MLKMQDLVKSISLKLFIHTTVKKLLFNSIRSCRIKTLISFKNGCPLETLHSHQATVLLHQNQVR